LVVLADGGIDAYIVTDRMSRRSAT